MLIIEIALGIVLAVIILANLDVALGLLGWGMIALLGLGLLALCFYYPVLLIPIFLYLINENLDKIKRFFGFLFSSNFIKAPREKFQSWILTFSLTGLFSIGILDFLTGNQFSGLLGFAWLVFFVICLLLILLRTILNSVYKDSDSNH